MATATVTALPQPKATTKLKAKPQPKVQASARRVGQERLFFAARSVLTAVNVGVIAVSVTDIAACVTHYGHLAAWQGYAIAGGVDLNYVGMEFGAMLAPTPALKARIHAWTRFAVPAIAVVSAASNMTEMAATAVTTFDIAAACVIGAFLPAVAYVTNRVLGEMYDR